MADRNELIAFRDRLERALTLDVREVQDSDDSRIVYRSAAEIRSAISYIDGQLATQPVRTIRFNTSKGL
jgi:hypothetical protein